jgi:hypothetical protein
MILGFIFLAILFAEKKFEFNNIENEKIDSITRNFPRFAFRQMPPEIIQISRGKNRH